MKLIALIAGVLALGTSLTVQPKIENHDPGRGKGGKGFGA